MLDVAGAADAPDGVIEVVREAIARDLLSNVDSLAAGLETAGWVRSTEAGLWRLKAHPEWVVVSSGHAPNVSIFVNGSDEAVVGTAERVRDELDAGAAGTLERSAVDPDWTMWSGGSVVVSLNATTARRRGDVMVSAVMQLAIERSDAPSEGLAPDPELARRIARTGSPLQRWYLAAERELPSDVVSLLNSDEDPDVSAAMEVRVASPAEPLE
ncbi:MULTISPECIES: hypothetical protein [Microbacterium]|uniref:Uncharacterized protein n=1 Tax=Microbacterium wangchenii TaxID=2541726 RepID=A0ABX5SV79_9MICO|nr:MULTISPECIES: hypothetical protein [Microbacterium]MCK6065759.1 hypothetical protein [Microbacterium sp. EYE_512]QBR90076.1 hypothetical protein E4K62_16135 [Microbacterium wangchenii]